VWWKDLKQELDDITDTQEDETETEYKWLFTPNDLARTQGKADYKSIWIITSSPFEHALEPEVHKMLLQNLKRGITYKYIARASSNPDTQATIEQIRLMSADYPKLSVREVEGKSFSSQAVTDYIIMNPDMKPDSDEGPKLRAFLKLPVTSGEYWIEVSDGNAAVGLVERFKAWADEEDNSGTHTTAVASPRSHVAKRRR
jgi:hypothetical protein